MKSLLPATFSLLVLFAGCAHLSLEPRPESSDSVSIRPFPVPEDDQYPHPMAVLISPPWKEEGEWRLRAPETLGSNRGTLFIDHWRDDMQPVTWPRRPLEWKETPEDGLGFECELDMGIVLTVRLTPGRNDLTVESALVNATGAPLENMGFQFCLVQTDVPNFVDPLGERTYIYMDSRFVPIGETKPGPAPGEKPLFIVTNTWDLEPWKPWEPGPSWFIPEQADIPLIATVSKDGKHIVAVAFENSYKIMSNCRNPCIHADPKLPDAAPGEIVKTRGRIYFVEGTLSDLLKLFERDFPDWQHRPQRYILPEKVSSAR